MPIPLITQDRLPVYPVAELTSRGSQGAGLRPAFQPLVAFAWLRFLLRPLTPPRL